MEKMVTKQNLDTEVFTFKQLFFCLVIFCCSLIGEMMSIKDAGFRIPIAIFQSQDSNKRRDGEGVLTQHSSGSCTQWW